MDREEGEREGEEDRRRGGTRGGRDRQEGGEGGVEGRKRRREKEEAGGRLNGAEDIPSQSRGARQQRRACAAWAQLRKILNFKYEK